MQTKVGGDARPLEPDAATFDALTAQCVAFVREHLASLPEQASADLEGAEALAASFREPLPAAGRPLDEILARLRPAVLTSFNTAGPGYLAFIPGGGLYAAALADYVALAVNRYVGVNRAAPVLAQIERTAVRWLGDLMGYPEGARGLITSGGSMSNFTALVTARVARLPEDFLRGTIYVSSETHLSVEKAARLAGFPLSRVRRVAVDARRRLVPEALERAIEEDTARGLTPFFVVANVGTTNTGAIDPLEDVLDVAARRGLWVHADGAYGGLFAMTAAGARAMRGVERCDSVTLDPHKTLFLPYGTGCLLVREGDALARAHAGEAEYLRDVAADGDGEPNFSDLSPELSRDFRGLRLWLPLMLHGVDAFRAQLEEKLALARWAYDELAADGRFEMLDEPQLSVVAFRLRGREGDGSDVRIGNDGRNERDDRDGRDDDARNLALLERVNARGRVFLSSTVLDGRVTLRICVLSFRTHADRMRDAVEALCEEARLAGRRSLAGLPRGGSTFRGAARVIEGSDATLSSASVVGLWASLGRGAAGGGVWFAARHRRRLAGKRRWGCERGAGGNGGLARGGLGGGQPGGRWGLGGRRWGRRQRGRWRQR